MVEKFFTDLWREWLKGGKLFSKKRECSRLVIWLNILNVPSTLSLQTSLCKHLERMGQKALWGEI